ncbi:orexin receptor type 2 [Aplysia californica]|uniref:Orexin receptor type 2 n=1 Tax=Aplysia californica TaxID=6500 RepID=A0ABM1A296_APLCA|nr:orexin receptor type 2 [Aplysia californica]
MLIAIVLLFAACYLPINLIFVLRNLNLFNAIDNPSIPIFFMFSYWLCYFNSAMNPLIYNFMSAKFKKEFRNVFHCRSRENIPLHYESTWFHSSRIRHNASNQTSSRMLRVHDSTYPALRQNKNHRAIDEDRVANGESV